MISPASAIAALEPAGIAAPPAPDAEPAGQRVCRGCGAAVDARFCGACGEEWTAGRDYSLRRFARESVAAVADLDSTLLRVPIVYVQGTSSEVAGTVSLLVSLRRARDDAASGLLAGLATALASSLAVLAGVFSANRALIVRPLSALLSGIKRTERDGARHRIAVTGVGATVGDARELAYRGVAAIEFDGARSRSDIAASAAAGVTPP